MGGVADYSELVARGLAQAGDEVEVWAPASPGRASSESRICVRGLQGQFGPRALRELNRGLRGVGTERQLLVQYVPQAFGLKGSNVWFCLWLFTMRNARISVMFHEVAYPFGWKQSLRQNALAATNRVMAFLVARAASRILVSVPAWARTLRPLVGNNKPITWLPVPSNVPVACNALEGRDAVRGRFADQHQILIGHFGTYGSLIADLLIGCLPVLLKSHANCSVLLLGRGSLRFMRRLVGLQPQLAGRVHATGSLEAKELSRHISACDLMFQPYPDGISARRTSAMVALSHGVALATNCGAQTESCWRESKAVCLSEDAEAPSLVQAAERLIDDDRERRRLAIAALRLYAEKFDLKHTVTELRRE